jgi:hypothetical protein
MSPWWPMGRRQHGGAQSGAVTGDCRYELLLYGFDACCVEHFVSSGLYARHAWRFVLKECYFSFFK